jgi:hypothetical protein
VVEQMMMIMMVVMAMEMIKCSGLEKKKEKNKKFKAQVYLIRALCFGDQDT